MHGFFSHDGRTGKQGWQISRMAFWGKKSNKTVIKK